MHAHRPRRVLDGSDSEASFPSAHDPDEDYVAVLGGLGKKRAPPRWQRTPRAHAVNSAHAPDQKPAKHTAAAAYVGGPLGYNTQGMMRETNPQAQDRPRPPVVSREHVYVCKFCLQEQLPGTTNPVSAAAVCVLARGTNRANAKATTTAFVSARAGQLQAHHHLQHLPGTTNPVSAAAAHVSRTACVVERGAKPGTTTAFVFACAGQLQAHYRQHHSEYATPPAQEHTLKQHVYDYLARQAREDNYARMRQRQGQAKRIQTGAQQVHAFWTSDGAARAHEYNAVVEAVRGAGGDWCCDDGVDDEASESESDSFVVADGEGETSDEESRDAVEEQEDEDGLLELLESEVRYKGAMGVVTGLDFETVLFTVVFEDGRCEWRADKVRRFAVRSERKVRKGAPRIAVLEDLARKRALVEDKALTTEHGTVKQRKRVWQADSSSDSA